MNAWLGQYVVLTGYYENACTVVLALLKSGAIVLLAAALAVFLQRRSAAARNWVWRGAFAGLLALAVSVFVPGRISTGRINVAVPLEPQIYQEFWKTAETYHLTTTNEQRNAIVQRQIQAREAAMETEVVPPWKNKYEGVSIGLTEMRPDWGNRLESLVMPVWLGVAALLALIGAVRNGTGVWRLRRRSAVASENVTTVARTAAEVLGVRAVPRVRIAEGLSSPLLMGLWKPVIYLPTESGDWNGATLRSVFLHELAHWKRGDGWWQLAAVWLCRLWWWQPLAWVACGRLKGEAELAADDLVILHQTEPAGYAETLVSLAAGLPRTGSPGAGISMLGRHPLEKRIRALLAENRWRGRLGVAAVVAIVLLIAVGLGGAATRVVGAMPGASAKAQQERVPLSAQQRGWLQAIQKSLEARLTAMRYLHFKLETVEHRKDLATGETSTSPQPSRLEAWVDEWSGKHRAEFRPQVSVWFNGAAPFSIRDTTMINDGKYFYYLYPHVDLSDVRGQKVTPDFRHGLNYHLGVQHEESLLRIASNLLASGVLKSGQESNYVVDEIEWKGRKVVRLVEQFFHGLTKELPSQQMTFYVDPANDYSVVYYELSWPALAEKNRPSQYGVEEMAKTVEGLSYPKRYWQMLRLAPMPEDRFKTNEEERTSEITVTQLDVLPGLPAGITDLPKPREAAFIAPKGQAVKRERIEFELVNAKTGQLLAGVPVKAEVNHDSDQKLTTDGAGKCVVMLPKKDIEFLCVTANHPDFAQQQVRWNRQGDPLQLPASYRLKLQPGSRISGRVTNMAGEPVSGALVEVWLLGEESRSSVFREGQAYFCLEVKTDAEGKWFFERFPDDLKGLGIRISHPDYQATTDHGLADFRTSTGLEYTSLRDGSCVMKLSKGHVLEGRVVDVEGKPVPDCVVIVGRDRWGANLPSLKTNADGVFALKGLAGGKHWVTWESPRHKPLAMEVTLPLPQPLPVTLQMGRVLRGRVVKEDGTPSAGMNVDVDTWKELRTLAFHTVTDAEGRFVWYGAPDEPVEFNFGACQGGLFLSGLYLSPREEEQTISLKPALRVKGRVVDAATGQPITVFQMTPGNYWAPGNLSWDRERCQTFRDGAFEWKTDRMSPKRIFRIEAEGYESLESEPFEPKQQEVGPTFRLTAKRGADGTAGQ